MGVDLVEPPEVPQWCRFIQADVLQVIHTSVGLELYSEEYEKLPQFDFIVASSPCDEFACFQMRHFHANPPYPALGIKLFNHTRGLCEASGVPYLMENVRAAQQFVGQAMTHSGSFYLWGNAVPFLTPKVHKAVWGSNKSHGRTAPGNFAKELLLPKRERKAKLATIPPELANCVADYAERLLEQRDLEIGRR